VSLWTEHDAERLPLPPPSEDDPLLAAMRARRSYRGFAPDLPVELDAIRDCLVAGLGIVGFFETATPGEGPLPLAMTPSGGARNPYEGYLLAARVSGLDPGVYHYAGIDNTLARIGAGAPPSFASLLGGQSWFEDAAALVVLVASFPRTMWKYPHPGALRVVFVEAGHIAQNMLLCATARGLAAAPTCAIADRLVEEACRLDRATQGAVYVIGLGARGAPSIGDIREVIPNPRLGWVKGS
jgi:SagB-type dehydrogenase family enzyme